MYTLVTEEEEITIPAHRILSYLAKWNPKIHVWLEKDGKPANLFQVIANNEQMKG